MQDVLAADALSGLLLDHAPVAVALVDTEMHYLACSRRWLTDFNLADRPVLGRSRDEVGPPMNAVLCALHRRGLAGESVSSPPQSLARPDGTIDWLEWTISPWRDRAGRIGGLVLYAAIVTEAVEARSRLHALAAELALLVDTGYDRAICMLDPAGTIMVWNSGAERLYGWTEREVVGRPYAMTFGIGDRADGLPAHQIEGARCAGSFRGQSWRLRKDGSRFHAEVALNRIDDEAGHPLGYWQVVRDTTQDDETARATDEREAFLHAILDTVPDSLITIDQAGIILSFSARAERDFGYAAAEVIGRNVAMLLPESEGAQHDGYLARIIGTTRRLLGRRKDGSLFPHTLFVGEAKGGGKTVFTGFLRDLTEQEAAEARLAELQAELMHMSRVSAIGTMATALAHELNQPLTAIVNYLQASSAILVEGREEARDLVREALDEAGRQALHAGVVVQRLREFVARGEIERTIASPRELVLLGSELGAAGARLRGVTCKVRVPADLPSVLVDRVQIQQVLLNLIRNALEALGERGTVTIGARAEDGMIRFSVIDDGPGVTPGKEAAVFEPFISSKSTGMGLGLAICRTIVAAHGGRMWCDAAPQGGAAFHFTVPLAEDEHE
jgi:two-component system, LuxR family, sensor kinase FixL